MNLQNKGSIDKRHNYQACTFTNQKMMFQKNWKLAAL